MHERVVAYETGLPVGFDRETGDLVNFEQARENPGATIPTVALTDAQRTHLARARIEAAADWPTREFHPGGIVDRDRALAEVETPGEIGRLLVQTEVGVAEWVLSALRKENPGG